MDICAGCVPFIVPSSVLSKSTSPTSTRRVAILLKIVARDALCKDFLYALHEAHKVAVGLE